MEEMEQICFQIISSVGTARSMYIEAIHLAKEKKFEEAQAILKDGQNTFVQGHTAHASLIQKEAAGEDVKMQLLLIHAEDQLMSAEGFGILAEEFIDLYQTIYS